VGGRREGRQLLGILLTARGAADPADLPGEGAERAVEDAQRASPVPGPGGIFREDTQAPPPQKTQLPETRRSGGRPVSRKRRA